MLRQIDIARNEFFDPLADPGQVTGFTSPATDYEQKRLDLTELLINDPTNTHYFQAEGDNLHAFGIEDGDLIVVDKSLPHTNGTIVVCDDGYDFTVKQLPIIEATETIYTLWGVITSVCKFKIKRKLHVRIG